MTNSLESLNDLTEKVAIAICPWDNGKLHKGSPELYWQGMKESFKEAYRAQAKAAIAAMGDASARKHWAEHSDRYEIGIKQVSAIPIEPETLIETIKRNLLINLPLAQATDEEYTHCAEIIAKAVKHNKPSEISGTLIQRMVWGYNNGLTKKVDSGCLERDECQKSGMEAVLEIIRPSEISVIDAALEEAAKIVLNLKPEMKRDKPEEWEACYAALFRQLNEVCSQKRESVDPVWPSKNTAYECSCGHKWLGDGSDMNCPKCNPTREKEKNHDDL